MHAMPTLQRIIDLSILIFVAVFLGMSLVLGWTTPLEGRSVSRVENQAQKTAGVFGQIQGAIRDKQGNPVQRAKVSLFQPGRDEPITVTETDDLGHYRMHELDAGLYILQAEHPALETGRKIVMVEVQGRCIMDFTLANTSPGAASGERNI
jgi:hypothetical protein